MLSTTDIQPLTINLGPLPADERLAFVDRACFLARNGRYGPPRMSLLLAIIDRERPIIDRAVFLDLTAHRAGQYCPPSEFGAPADQASTAGSRSGQTAPLLSAPGSTALPLRFNSFT